MSALAIEDRFALQDLIAAYSWALDTGDGEALALCFTEDARMVEEVFEDPDVWDGRDGIRAMMAHYGNAPGFPGRQHHVTQVQFTPDGPDSCRLRSFAFVTECHGEPPYTLRFAGYYDDLAVRDGDGAWRFRSRTVRLWDGEVLRRFPGHGEWTPRQRPDSLKRR